MKLHVTLVNPPYPTRAHVHPSFIPIGLGYLAAVLEKNQYEVDVIDCQVLKLSYEGFKEEISKSKPNVVGITSATLTYKSALKIAKIIKEVVPDCLIILGGCHATFWDNEALQECPEIDIIVRKEGENTLLELIGRIEAGNSYHDVLGTTCRKNGEIIKNPDRPYLEDLDSLPFPAHHLWPIERIRKEGRLAAFPVTTSRGCVFWCDFCTTVRMAGRKYRKRSTKNVVDELEYLHKTYGAEEFTFYDDVFTGDQARTEEICDEIINRKLKVKWNCETRVDMVTKDLLLKMKEAGCTDIWFGIESGSQKVIDAMRKGISVDQTTRAFKWAKEVGLVTIGFVVVGFPGETKESIWETVKVVKKINPNDVVYHVATPYQGTPLADLVRENGWLRVTDFDKYDTATPIFETPQLSMKDLREIRERALQKFYLRPGYSVNFFAKAGVHGTTAVRLFLAHLLRAIKFKLGFNKVT